MSEIQEVLAHEEKITGLIHKLYELVQKEKDHALTEELTWFVKEQVEEEKNATEIVANLRRIGEHGPALLMLDKALGERKD